MVYRKGERTNKHREREYPFAVDIPIPPATGLGDNLTAILAAEQDCPGEVESWSYSTQVGLELRRWWHRIGTRSPTDADRLASLFASLGARRVR
jgi:hypothetical protein